MQTVRDKEFHGERPLFGMKGLRMERVKILEGESGVKCCDDVEAHECEFVGKYVLWHVDRSLITNCHFSDTARSSVWYSRDMTMRDTVVDAPKFFREVESLKLENVTINDADETFWRVRNIEAKNLTLHGGRYPFMFCENVRVDGLTSDSLYVFQYCRDVEIRNARILTKDSLWECDGVTVYDSLLDGEYLGWHSRNIRLVRCHIVGEQPLSYMDGITLEDCTFDPACDRAFEDSTRIDARIKGHIANVKNPTSGRIVADSIGEVTIDEFIRRDGECEIVDVSRQ